MDWATPLTGMQWFLLLLVPPAIIALYFLKLRRQPLEVPSTYLWRKSMEDLHVNSLWQRMRQNILLLLQLLLLALVMLALLRPNWQSTGISGERLIFLIDNSASMRASDVDGTRLDEAKRQVAALIDTMESSQQAMLISFSNTAHVQQSLTGNKRALQAALDRIEATDRSTSLEEALRVAAAMANPGSMRDEQMVEDLAATLYIVSDGRFPDVVNFSLGNLEPVYVPVGKPDTANVGIVAFGTRESEKQPDRLQAFGRLENTGGEAATVGLELYLDGQLIDASQASVPAGGEAGVVFGLQAATRGALRLRLANSDALAADNEAWATIGRARDARVLVVTEGSPVLQHALATSFVGELAEISFAPPATLTSAEHQRQAAEGYYDLIVYHAVVPPVMPRCNTLMIGVVPPTGWSRQEAILGPAIIDVSRSHPLMQYVEMSDVDIYRATPLELPPGGKMLVESAAGTIVGVGPREGFEDVVIGFDFETADDDGEAIANTSWPIRQSFPVFVLNALSYLAGADASSSGISVRPGQTVSVRSATSAKQVSIRSPSGKVSEAPRGKLNAFPFIGTSELGTYDVVEAGEVTQQFAVNLFDPGESDLRVRKDPLQIGYVDVPGEAREEPVRREAWKLLLLASLAVLLLEWYVYNKRVAL